MEIDKLLKLAEYLEETVYYSAQLYRDSRGGYGEPPDSPDFKTPEEAEEYIIQQIRKDSWVSGHVVAKIGDEIMVDDVQGFPGLGWTSPKVKKRK